MGWRGVSCWLCRRMLTQVPRDYRAQRQCWARPGRGTGAWAWTRSECPIAGSTSARCFAWRENGSIGSADDVRPLDVRRQPGLARDATLPRARRIGTESDVGLAPVVQAKLGLPTSFRKDDRALHGGKRAKGAHLPLAFGPYSGRKNAGIAATRGAPARGGGGSPKEQRYVSTLAPTHRAPFIATGSRHRLQ